MQKTSSGGGYHVWHGEQGNGAYANRGLVYMLYLNTLPPEANGETEFLYQQRRINPVGNTMVLGPLHLATLTEETLFTAITLNTLLPDGSTTSE